MLMPKVLPKNFARSTRFIDMAAVYEGLPQAVKNKLAGREFMHTGKMRYKVRTQDAGYDIFEDPRHHRSALPGCAPPGGDRAPLHQGKGDLRQPRLHARYRRRLASMNSPRC